jgi:molybdopterin synthase sulfur carrier subunit
MKIKVAGAMARLVDYQKEVDVDGATVRQGLNQLMERYPDLKKVMLDGDGNVRKTHHIFLDGESLPVGELDHAAGPDDTVQIMTAIAGG